MNCNLSITKVEYNIRPNACMSFVYDIYYVDLDGWMPVNMYDKQVVHVYYIMLIGLTCESAY